MSLEVGLFCLRRLHFVLASGSDAKLPIERVSQYERLAKGPALVRLPNIVTTEG